MKTETSNTDKTEAINYEPLLATGLKVIVDKDKGNNKIVTVLKQSEPTRKRTYVTSEMIVGWWIETVRLTPCC